MVSEVVYVALVLVSSTVTLATGLWLWSPGRDRSRVLFVLWCGLHATLGLLVIGSALSSARWLVVAFFLAGTVVALAVPPVAFLFALSYTDRARWLSRSVLSVLGAWYGLLAFVVLTHPFLGLAFESVEIVAGPIGYAVGIPTPVYGVVSFPSLLLAIAAPAILGARALSDSGLTRRQSVSLLAGFLVPYPAMSIWFAGLFPGPLNGVFVLGSALTCGVVVWAVDRYHLFDVVPMSREMAFDQIGEAVVLLDRDRRLLDYNRVAAEAFPSLEGAIGSPIDELVPAFVGDHADDGAVSFTDTVTTYAADGPRTYELTASELPSEASFRGYGLVLRDVTERRRRLRDLEQQTAQLERFASTLSHDIRNPLTVLRGRLELAREDGDREALAAAEDAVERIEQIVEDLLTLSREGRTIDEPEPVRLADVAEEAWRTTDTADATLDVAIDPDYEVYADATRLRNVFENLFRNAVSFGGAEATIRVGWHDDGFFVEDDGPGISADERDRVFDYEYTGTESGTGLGLAIVQSIARAHGWSIAAEDGSSGGARFAFSGIDVVPGEPTRSGVPLDD